MTPSKIRRMGREAFEPFVDLMDLQPFEESSWDYEYNLKRFKEGWKEAGKAFNAKQANIVECDECDADHNETEDEWQYFKYCPYCKELLPDRE